MGQNQLERGRVQLCWYNNNNMVDLATTRVVKCLMVAIKLAIVMTPSPPLVTSFDLKPYHESCWQTTHTWLKNQLEGWATQQTQPFNAMRNHIYRYHPNRILTPQSQALFLIQHDQKTLDCASLVPSVGNLAFIPRILFQEHFLAVHFMPSYI